MHARSPGLNPEMGEAGPSVAAAAAAAFDK
jgi:hypothetical protein